MSRRARHGRHRRRSRTSRTVGAAVPLAVGGVVAGAALIATPFDAGHPRRGDGAAAGPPDRDSGTLITFPSASGDPGTPEPAASAVPTAADRATTQRAGESADTVAGESTGPAQAAASRTSGNRVQPASSSASSSAGGGSGDSGNRGSGGSGSGDGGSPPPQTPPAEPDPAPVPLEPPVTLPAPLPSLPLPVVSLPGLP